MMRLLIVCLTVASVSCDSSSDPVVPLYQTCAVTAECVREAEGCLPYGPGFDGIERSVCSISCTDNSDCPGNANCADPGGGLAPLCLAPSTSLYGPCVFTAECASEAEACLPYGPDFDGNDRSICSVPCTDNSDCPAGGVCFDPDGDLPPLCLQPCTRGCTDCCEEGLTCRQNLPPEPLCRP